MSEFEAKRVAIVGVGLLGGSLGLALRESGWGGTLIGIGRTQATLDRAVELGCVDEATTDLSKGIAGADVIVLATPVSTIIAQLAQLGEGGIGGAVVTDVGSTKEAIVGAAEAALGDSAGQFCGSHPMAGKTDAGPEAAEAGLFKGRPCVVTPTDRTDDAARATVEAMWAAVGAKLVTLSPEDHDFQTAVVSHLPHLAGVLLTQTAMEGGGWDVASTGFESATRLASSNPLMRMDIVRDNREQILAAIDAFIGRLDALCEALETDNADALREAFEAAKAARDLWVDGRDN